MRIEGKTLAPRIVKNEEGKYVIVGSIDHGMEIPQSSVLGLISSLEGVEALAMEASEETHKHLQAMSTELMVKASVGQAPIHYLSGCSPNEDIGGVVLKYAQKRLAEIFVPAVYVRNSLQLGQEPNVELIVAFTSAQKGRFGFLDIARALEGYMKLVAYWEKNKLDAKDLDHFSHDFEKFVGDIREFELWQPELKEFRNKHEGKVAVCVGDYHVPFVQAVLDGREVQAPNWETHIDNRREDETTPQDADFLRGVYRNIENALKE